MIRFSVADLRMTVLEAGSLWLDGGAMFGVVPKTLWQRQRPADERNRIRLAMNLLLVEDGRRRILIDTGAGTRWDEKSRGMYGLDCPDASEILAPAGLVPEQIDLVVNTHLHFDHAGGNTKWKDGKAVGPAYPNARFVVQRGEIEMARHLNERTRAAYRAEDFEPLADDDRLEIVEGDATLTPHLQLRLAPGHTPHLQVPIVVTRERTVAFLNDLVPTSSHVSYPWIMGYDLEPLATLASKKRILPEAAREKWYVVFEHDPELPIGTLEERQGVLRARPLPATEA